ncbi:MAG: NAD(P)H-dependent oxidoreductase [Planctomycetales bacterium]|nr:NAD(P)H-dependent oxidoreductase [Planctomycetales bacterium]
MSTPKILAFAGSARRDSYNKRLVRVAMRGAQEAGAEVAYLDLRDFPLPIFNQDFESEEGIPEHAVRLKEIFLDHQGILLACPEYNSSITPLLKNTIDWVSRSAEGEGPLEAFQGKCAAIMSASPGALGGLRGLTHVREILGNIGVLVLPRQQAISQAHEAFDGEGNLKDGTLHKRVLEIGAELANIAKQLAT